MASGNGQNHLEGGSNSEAEDDQLHQPLLETEAGVAEELPPSYERTTFVTDRRHRDGHRVHESDNEQERRILDRDRAFFQSRGRWRVQHVSRESARVYRTPKAFWDDWFHYLAYQRTVVLMMILFVSYTAIVFNFAFIYLFVSKLGEKSKINQDGSISTLPFCEMDIHNHMEALYFSLSTMASIGYGVSDYYFGGCWTPFLLVLAQVCCAITFHAVAIGLIFQRISRGHKRGKTVLFSDKAVVRNIQGVPYLMFRVGELRHHQLLEATVRSYCIRHERHADAACVRGSLHESQAIETIHYVTKPMKFLYEDVSSHIIMSLPQVIVHRIDDMSPLMPPRKWWDTDGREHQVLETGASLDDIREFFRDREAEIVILLEGMDELTGSSSQTRHSYILKDVGWNQSFVPCVYPYEQRDIHGVSETTETLRQRTRSLIRREGPLPVCVVDFARFHDTAPAPSDSVSGPYVLE